MTVRSRVYKFETVERRWRRAWEKNQCFRADLQPGQEYFFNYDSGPFPNGELHLGHVRTYVLGDVTARYQRLRGKCVLYCTEWDSFGLPNELAALKSGISPRSYTRACIETMESQLRRLGISYDWEHVKDTSDPEYFRWTQWLFLEMLDAGIVEQRDADVSWCPRCQTALARMQVVENACWRCDSAVEVRPAKHWSIALSRFSRQLLISMTNLDEWSGRSKKLLRGFIVGAGNEPDQVHDWVVSRQRVWGTPIPIVHCDRCGAVPVPQDSLPVTHPENLDWSAGALALAECDEFVSTTCPKCNSVARRDTDTLDCYFDDIWCHIAGAADLGRDFAFGRNDFADWRPVDLFHSGYDTFLYLHLHRFLGIFLVDRGILESPELIRSYRGHDMVLASGQKMSKHLNNSVFAGKMLDSYGADALRVAMLWAANPDHPVHFDESLLGKASMLLDRMYSLYDGAAEKIDLSGIDELSTGSTRAARRIRRRAAADFHRIGALIEDYRPCAALEVFSRFLTVVIAYTRTRLGTGRLSRADRDNLASVLCEMVIVVSPFAPHLAEECFRLLGGASFVAQARWPESVG